MSTQGCRCASNPGLKLSNAFGVNEAAIVNLGRERWWWSELMILQSGDLFRRFRVLGKAGQGGMGVVYRAHDINLDRDVALKFVTQVGDHNPELNERLRREARSLAALSHPNIVARVDPWIGEAKAKTATRGVGLPFWFHDPGGSPEGVLVTCRAASEAALLLQQSHNFH